MNKWVSISYFSVETEKKMLEIQRPKGVSSEELTKESGFRKALKAEGNVLKKPGGNARREYEFLEPARSLELYQRQAVRRDVSIYMEGGIIGRGIFNL